MFSKSRLIGLALVQVTFIAAMQPAEAKPTIAGGPFTINPDTAKATCMVVDGVFAFAADGGFTCTYATSEAEFVLLCTVDGACLTTRESHNS